MAGLGFVVCFLYKTNPNPRKTYFDEGKSGPNATFRPTRYVFLGVGLALLGWGVRRFHNNINIFSNPT